MHGAPLRARPARPVVPVVRLNAAQPSPVACRPLDGDVCEVQRLYRRQAFVGRGFGRKLAVAIVEAGKAAGYQAMRLDTVPTMAAALGLYASLGFFDIPPYRENPIPGARYMELLLR